MVYWVIRSADEHLIRNRRHLHGLLRQAVKQLAARGGIPPIETKRELVQIVIQVFGGNRSWCVPSSQRLSKEATRCTLGRTSVAVLKGWPLSLVISWA